MYQTDCLYSETLSIPSSLRSYWDGLSIAVLDLETTGLDAGRNHLILAGLLTEEAEGLRTRQFLAQTPREEALVLSALAECIPRLDILITYNGNQFDLPFLAKRLRRYEVSEFDQVRRSLSAISSFDFYSVLRRFSPLGKALPDLKQKTVEDYMGLSSFRTDVISGAESARQYAWYVKTKLKELRDQILLHNRDDILQLARLLPVLNKLDIHRIMAETGFPICRQLCPGQIKSVKLSQRDCQLKATGTIQALTVDCRSFLSCCQFFYSAKTGQFSLSIPLKEEQGYGFVDLEALDRELPSRMWTEFQTDPWYESGYLILSVPEGLRYAQANQLAEKILTEIVSRMCYNN